MPKAERSLNPTAAHHKAEKQKAINKNKKQLQTQRNEKLSRRNPDRIQQQIDEIKALESQGSLRPKDKELLASLERDLRGVRKAREGLGDKAPTFAGRRVGGVREEQRERRQQQGSLGKRRRGTEEAHASASEDDSEIDPAVLAIPMPRDTPPPFPRALPTDGSGRRVPHALPTKPVPAAPAQTTYSSAPQLRDLKKEAVRFVPAAVAMQKARVKGAGRLLEPEEADRAEKAGYLGQTKVDEGHVTEETQEVKSTLEDLVLKARERRLLDETKKFEQEMAAMLGDQETKERARAVIVEDVKDLGDET